MKSIRQWLHSAAARCYGVSVFVHLLILFVMGMVVFYEPIDDDFSITSGFGIVQDTDHASLDVTDTEFVLTPPVKNISPIERLAVIAATNRLVFSEPTLNSSHGGATTQKASSVGFKKGANAVSKGNFTAWTVPEDPKPWKDYLVVIQIRLPEDMTKYRQEDLSGFLTGDDGFTTPIGEFNGRGFPHKYYGEFDMTAKQFTIRIPGSAAKVQDKIEVRSKVLKEKQTLFIVF